VSTGGIFVTVGLVEIMWEIEMNNNYCTQSNSQPQRQDSASRVTKLNNLKEYVEQLTDNGV
jgi:hypothetical protein